MCSSAFAVQVLIEDFEDTTVTYTTSTPEFSDGTGDFWYNTADGSFSSGSFVVYNGADGNYFQGMDINGEGASLPVTMSFSGLNISGLTDLEFSIDLAEDDDGTNEDWDLSDFVHVNYQIDGGGFNNLLWIESVPDGDPYNSYPAIDTNFDGDGDGTAITDTFANFAASITGTGNVLDLEIVWDLGSGDEDLAIDNVSIVGVPEPASLMLLSLGALFLRRRR
jgi:hypothetical protein